KPKSVFINQDIYEYAWHDYYMCEDKTINVHISNIRQKIKQITAEPYIETVWGIGFKCAV
ncbi:MAG: winged helix-turn-helix domain-containing protein, partial [Clostridiales bacterium]|nr:winged helix-turn-helix domain-containing protein [Clostridiales bacterium]